MITYFLVTNGCAKLESKNNNERVINSFLDTIGLKRIFIITKEEFDSAEGEVNEYDIAYKGELVGHLTHKKTK